MKLNQNAPVSVAYSLRFEISAFASHHQLTPREGEILALLVEGVVRIKDVAERLNLSPNTVNNHINSIFKKTESRSKSHLLTEFLFSIAEELNRTRRYVRLPRVVICSPDESSLVWARAILAGLHCRLDEFRSHDEIRARTAKLAPDFLLAFSDMNFADQEMLKMIRQHTSAWVYFFNETRDEEQLDDACGWIRKATSHQTVAEKILSKYSQPLV